MRITIISLVFPPEPGAAKRVEELALELSSAGHDLTVVTGFPSYPKGKVFSGYKMSFCHKSIWKDKIQLIRMWLYTSLKRASFFHRLIHYLTFTFSSLIGSFIGPRPDIIYVCTPPYFLGLVGWIVKIVRKSKFVLDVQDFWPEAIINLGYIKNRYIIKLALYVERIIYKNANKIIVLSDVMKARIAAKGTPENKIVQVFNWCDIDKYKPVSGDERRVQHNLLDKFIIMFAGNIGIAQCLDTVLDAANLLKTNKDIQFVILGEGREKPRLMKKNQCLGLSNVSFLDGVPETEVPTYFGMADAFLVNLGRAKHREAAIPSKFQHYMSSAKPVIVAAVGATASLAKDAGCGLVIAPDNPDELAVATLKLFAMNEIERKLLGDAGREFAKLNFDLHQQCTKIGKNLQTIGDN